MRLSSSLLDIAAMATPVLPLSIAAAAFGSARLVYVVTPIAFVAVGLWIQIWQGITGASFGKAMMGLRLVRSIDNRPAGVGRVLLRSLVFVATAGAAALPVMRGATSRPGLHDRISGVDVLDETLSPRLRSRPGFRPGLGEH